MISRRRLLRRGLAGVPALFILSGCATLARRRSDMAATTSSRRVFLFSGHLIDAPDRATPRFPADKEPVAAAAIGATLDSLGCGDADLGICGGACGGDLLFAEAVLARGARLLMLLPFDEQTFLGESVDVAGPAWRQRFYAVKANPRTETRYAPDVLGPLPAGENAYERENRWLLDSALGSGADRVEFICLWNGGGGDGPGGTQHMVREVEQHGGRVHWLDTRTLWNLPP